ncbi:uncharacterized protein MYCFIDRAFT_197941 [Pseudocercospora fijiensis CIRAD86]|uniref:Uncharacterized protein n=1 Tax=Pseudocercospora fijiensis (strain CIRAD86) TaxID=383855 RepID=M2ZPY6_PSEFD|nr:uncharacterized protein MYCFIDRAFT_197941 [Pseudocercospora fijiensis CIRAD86]EME81139.1 hypothetical protein MYCFIDRAFT_197941 [Pseudocercospora fijiensis CIRAD86]
MKAAYFGFAATAGLALAAPPVARDEWPITLPWPTAAPIPTSNPDWQVCLYLTNDYSWQGYGVNLCMTNDQCSPKVPDSLNANISSAGPNEKEVCYLYSEINCTGTASAPITNPGYDNLGKIGFDKMARSWKCWRTDNMTASSSTTTSSTSSVKVSPSPFPESTSSSTTESRVTIVVTLPATSTTVSVSSSTTEWPTITTASTGDPKLPTTEETTTSLYSTVTGFGTQISPTVVTHTYLDSSTVVTTLMKRAEEAVSTTVDQKYICTTPYPLATYISTGSTSSLTTSWYTMWYQCPGHATLAGIDSTSTKAAAHRR